MFFYNSIKPGGGIRELSNIDNSKKTPLRRLGIELIKNRYLLLMLVVPVAFYIVLKYAPMYGVLIAFKNYKVAKGILGSPWVGLKWINKFVADPFFWRAVKNTLALGSLTLLFGMPAPLILALLINEVKHPLFKRTVQSITYLPHFISAAVIVGMIVTFLSFDGIVNGMIKWLGDEPINFMREAGLFRPIYVISGVWQSMGWGSIIYLAAISTINPELYEAAVVDGADRFKRIWYITIPGIVPTISIVFILQVGRLLKIAFEKVLLLYNPSIYDTADVIQTYAYRRGLVEQEFSYGTAINLFQSVIGMLLLIAANKLSKRLSGTGFW